jgi:Domain of unknown function (DUF4190)
VNDPRESVIQARPEAVCPCTRSPPLVPIILGFIARSQIKERFFYGRVERGRRLAISAIVAGFIWTAPLVLWIVLGLLTMEG